MTAAPKTGIVRSGATRVRDRLPAVAILRGLRRRLQLWRWLLAARPVPPPQLYKQRLVRRYGREHGIHCLVETGTYLGDMVAAQHHWFSRIYTIELDPALAARATERFREASNVTVLEGNSGEVLPSLLAGIHEPCVFWLDGHSSGGITAHGPSATPVRAEIAAILEHSRRDHVVLIDDARLFNGSDGYPTLAELRRSVSAARPEWQMAAEDDIIRLHPARVGGGSVAPGSFR